MTTGEVRQILTDLGESAAELRVATSTMSTMTKRLAASQTRLDSFLTNGDSVLAKINSGQGTLGRLVNDSSLYVGSDSLVAALRVLVAEVRAESQEVLQHARVLTAVLGRRDPCNRRKFAIIAAAERVAGVRAIAEEMRVLLPTSMCKTDIEIAHAAERAAWSAPGVTEVDDQLVVHA